MQEQIVYLGVDPAFRSGGFAICIIQQNTVSFKIAAGLLDYIKLVDELTESGDKICIGIENSNETNSTFIAKSVRSAAAREKISRDVGKNQAVSQIAVDYSKYRVNFGAVYSISPAEKGIKINHKTTEALRLNFGQIFKNYKGLAKEQDKRDAYKIALLARDRYLRDRLKK